MPRDADRRWVRALAAAVALAETARLALRPRDGVIVARPIDPLEYFDPGELTRARRHGHGQVGLAAASAATELALLAALVARGRTRVRGQPTLAAAGARGAGLALALTIAPLPFGALARGRALAVGLATQSWRGWALDVVRTAALAAGFSAAGGVIVAALMRRWNGRWWLPAGAGATGVAVLVTLVGPVLLEPIFNEFDPLPDGELRREVLVLARRAGVRVREIYAVDASRRTRAANAYVSGIGATRRIVLYDTLLSTFSAAEARTVVAHELAHVRYRDVPRLLAFVALVAPGALRATARLAERLERSDAPSLEALALAGAVVSSATGVVARQLSRAVERRADSFSLELTGDAAAFIAFERRITRQNVADPAPPRWLWGLLATHPPIVERIGTAAAYAAGERATRAARGPTSRRPRRRRSRRTRGGS